MVLGLPKIHFSHMTSIYNQLEQKQILQDATYPAGCDIEGIVLTADAEGIEKCVIQEVHTEQTWELD